MSVKTSVIRVCGVFAVVAALAVASPAYAGPYVVGGATGAIASASGDWAWDGAFLVDFRNALENPANFGPGGIVNQAVDTVDLNTVDALTLAGVNMFVAAWISDGQAAPMQAAVINFFLNGGDLFLLQDDSGHDAIGAALGLATTPSTGSVSNGGAPLFNGPFGTATNVTQHYAVGQLSAAAVAANNGHIGGTNATGQVTSAYWAAGEYAPGAGSLFIIADIDMIASTVACGGICGARYAPLNANGIYALNTFSFLQENGGTAAVPEPGTMVLLGLGLAGVVVARRRRSSAQ